MQGPGDPGVVAERPRGAQRDAEARDERDPAPREREERRHRPRKAEGIAVAAVAVETFERVQEPVDLLLDVLVVEDPPLGDAGEEVERPFNLSGHAFGLFDRLLGLVERGNVGLAQREPQLGRVALGPLGEVGARAGRGPDLEDEAPDADPGFEPTFRWAAACRRVVLAEIRAHARLLRSEGDAPTGLRECQGGPVDGTVMIEAP